MHARKAKKITGKTTIISKVNQKDNCVTVYKINVRKQIVFLNINYQLENIMEENMQFIIAKRGKIFRNNLNKKCTRFVRRKA